MKRVSLLMLWVFLTSCTSAKVAGTEIGNTRTTTIEIVGLTSSSVKLNPRAASSTSLTITEARVALKELHFKTLEECQNGVETGDIEFAGPYVSNLLTNATIPDLGSIQLPDAVYCRIDLKLAKLESDKLPTGISASDPMVGNSFYIAGTRGDGTPFIATLDRDENFRLENTAGFNLGTNVDSTLFIAFDYSQWFSGIDLTGADISGSGTILIDGSNNTTIRDDITKNIETSAALYEDKNKDGSLENTEAKVGDALAHGS